MRIRKFYTPCEHLYIYCSEALANRLIHIHLSVIANFKKERDFALDRIRSGPYMPLHRTGTLLLRERGFGLVATIDGRRVPRCKLGNDGCPPNSVARRRFGGSLTLLV